jgi:hypothetical protein
MAETKKQIGPDVEEAIETLGTTFETILPIAVDQLIQMIVDTKCNLAKTLHHDEFAKTLSDGIRRTYFDLFADESGQGDFCSYLSQIIEKRTLLDDEVITFATEGLTRLLRKHVTEARLLEYLRQMLQTTRSDVSRVCEARAPASNGPSRLRLLGMVLAELGKPTNNYASEIAAIPHGASKLAEVSSFLGVGKGLKNPFRRRTWTFMRVRSRAQALINNSLPRYLEAADPTREPEFGSIMTAFQYHLSHGSKRQKSDCLQYWRQKKGQLRNWKNYPSLLCAVCLEISGAELQDTMKEWQHLRTHEHFKTYYAVLIQKLCSSRSKERSVLGYSILEQELTRLSLDPNAILDAWDQGTDKRKLAARFGGLFSREQQVIEANMMVLFDLAETDQRAPSYLATSAGIHMFSRYPVEMLRQQYIERNNVKNRYALVVYPRSDHNSAFSLRQTQLKSLFEQVTRQNKELRSGRPVQLRVIEVDSADTFIRDLSAYRKKYGDASFGVISGHGDATGTTVGKSGPRSRLTFESLGKEGRKLLREMFAGPLLFVSCGVGALGGFAQKLSQATGLRITASDANSSIDHFDVSISPDSVEISGEYTKRQSKRVYDRGVLAV